MNVICYGDSNTWGYVPVEHRRYPADVRWTGVLADLLGEEYQILEDGVNGRTTVWENPYLTCRSGLEGLGYSLLAARPIDLVVVMLGTNDLLYTNGPGYYKGLTQIVNRVLHARSSYFDSCEIYTGEPKLLLVSPITLHPDLDTINPDNGLVGRYEESCRLARFTAQVAAEQNVPWVDAALCAEASALDGIHMTAESHRALGTMLAAKIKTML